MRAKNRTAELGGWSVLPAKLQVRQCSRIEQNFFRKRSSKKRKFELQCSNWQIWSLMVVY